MHTTPPRHSLRPRRRPTLRALWVPIGIAAALHLLLLSENDELAGASHVEPATVAMQIRAVPAQIDDTPLLAASPSKAVAKPAPTPAMATPAPATPTAVHRSVFVAPALPIPDEALRPTQAPPVEAGAIAEASSATPAAIPVDADLVKNVAASAPTGAADVSVPVYRTVLPPPSTLRYDLRKGFIPGSGELVWKFAADRYEARLEGSVAGMNLLTQTSTGTIDAHGIAPGRYTDARSRRGVNAANFQRDKGKISYSGPQVEYPLLPGSQDRVSWMIQIGAILNADPKLAAPEGKIVMFVSGANGDADVWVFRYIGAENLRTDSGVLRTVKFTREPRKAYDRSVEVWLAPTRNHLPIRARFTANAGGDAFELLLRDIQSP